MIVDTEIPFQKGDIDVLISEYLLHTTQLISFDLTLLPMITPVLWLLNNISYTIWCLDKE